MNKHNEGYVLVFVLVMVVVLSVFASMFWTLAEMNRNAYQSSVTSMQDKYQAMGEIEKIVSTMEVERIGIAPAKLIYEKDLDSPVIVSEAEDNTSVEIIAVSGDVQIECRYEIVDDAIVCTSYKISTIGGAD